MASRIPIPATAFSLDTRATRRKRPREHAADHLAFIRTLPCCVCGQRDATEAAHVREGSAMFGKRHTGKSEKPDDKWTVPLCSHHHRVQHGGSECEFWKGWRINQFALALALWVATGDHDVAEIIVSEHVKRARV